jgi:hypothetical protein
LTGQGAQKKGAGFRRRQLVRIHRGIWFIRTVEVNQEILAALPKKSSLKAAAK